MVHYDAPPPLSNEEDSTRQHVSVSLVLTVLCPTSGINASRTSAGQNSTGCVRRGRTCGQYLCLFLIMKGNYHSGCSVSASPVGSHAPSLPRSQPPVKQWF